MMMVEINPESTPNLGSAVLEQAEINLITHVLGPAFAINEADLAYGYDERRELGWDTLERVFAMQDALTDRRGEKLEVPDPLGWRPNDEQLEQLRTELAPTQRRFRMMRGVERCQAC